MFPPSTNFCQFPNTLDLLGMALLKMCATLTVVKGNVFRYSEVGFSTDVLVM